MLDAMKAASTGYIMTKDAEPTFFIIIVQLAGRPSCCDSSDSAVMTPPATTTGIM